MPSHDEFTINTRLELKCSSNNRARQETESKTQMEIK